MPILYSTNFWHSSKVQIENCNHGTVRGNKATALQLYSSTTLQPDSSTTLQLYNTTAQSTALQLYSPAPLQLHLYNATTLQPYNSAALELYNSWGRSGVFGYTVYCSFLNRVYGIFTLYSGIWDT